MLSFEWKMSLREEKYRKFCSIWQNKHKKVLKFSFIFSKQSKINENLLNSDKNTIHFIVKARHNSLGNWHRSNLENATWVLGKILATFPFHNDGICNCHILALMFVCVYSIFRFSIFGPFHPHPHSHRYASPLLFYYVCQCEKLNVTDFSYLYRNGHASLELTPTCT